ncbi:unnamed protein product [Dovyalis caffra]|uniref:Uncharacterized protein n=1 Tax=Dovyalis caffra TaxID=77055 RepID=A0AAV1SC30_9ROSI|nr:unnamed protein product [Dovyalis caffra]
MGPLGLLHVFGDPPENNPFLTSGLGIALGRMSWLCTFAALASDFLQRMSDEFPMMGSLHSHYWTNVRELLDPIGWAFKDAYDRGAVSVDDIL